MQIITELNAQENMTVIMVIHDINHARLYADDVVIIKNKGVFAGGCPAEIITPPNLAEVGKNNYSAQSGGSFWR